jgi:RNA polymerase sigma-70 factor (ECF subfamily)
MLSDAELLQRWGENDDRAGTELFKRHYSPVFRFFRAKATGELEDLVQETFLQLVRGRARFRGDASFRAYLFGTARNVLKQHFRRRQRKEGNIDFGTHSVMDLGESPSALVADKAEKRLLLEALRRLAVDDQIVLELFWWESMTALEVGAVLDLNEPAVRSRLHRAKARLGAIMQQLDGGVVLESTASDLDGWAQRVRDDLEPG